MLLEIARARVTDSVASLFSMICFEPSLYSSLSFFLFFAPGSLVSTYRYLCLYNLVFTLSPFALGSILRDQKAFREINLLAG